MLNLRQLYRKLKCGQSRGYPDFAHYFMKGDKMARVLSLGSGSSGNCFFVGDANSGVLIDAGISFKSIKTALEEYDVPLESISAVLITHEHSDHVKGLSTLFKKTDVPVYASKETVEYILEHIPQSEGKIHSLELKTSLKAGETEFYAFSVYHDSRNAVGYRIKTPDNRCVVYSTDVGHIDDDIFKNLTSADLNIIEANYDEGMLMCNVSYPFLLKKRISGDYGHLSNNDCAKTVCRLIKSGCRRFVLAHLSRENNTPDVALETVKNALDGEGLNQNVDYEICVAPREEARMLIF